jgi:predicted RNA-binding Zn-ribbon protein involved in translation (DUF1610 family)
VKICGHCDQAIKPGEQYTEYPIDSPSLAGTTIYRHDHPCRTVPRGDGVSRS